ncbi:hypothetical protein HZ99_09730 [Pseudomonas fluorescens]|nr:hypothetical protein HZ99_09730 [Pseudomonas fluorescens]
MEGYIFVKVWSERKAAVGAASYAVAYFDMRHNRSPTQLYEFVITPQLEKILCSLIQSLIVSQVR